MDTDTINLIMKSIQGDNKKFMSFCKLDHQPTKKDYAIFKKGIEYALKYTEYSNQEKMNDYF